MDERRCANCGSRPSATVKLRRCTRCLSVRYCSVECQRSDYRSHKTSCKSPAGLPPGVSRTMPSPLGVKAAFSGGYRDVVVQEPSNVLCCCWCCGQLLKACGPNGTNPAQDTDGPFWTETYGRAEGDDSGQVEPGRTFPAMHVLGAPGSTGFFCGTNSHGQAAACLACAHNLRSSKAAAEHLRRCDAWLQDDALRQKFHQNSSCLSVAERRILSPIILDQTPDLTCGKESIAGSFTKKGEKKTLLVPFNYRRLEETAFPLLFSNAVGFKGKSKEDLIAYTMMRLYSAEKRWRQDTDYVVFSIHRLAAFGVTSVEAVVSQLPVPVTKNASAIKHHEISLKPGFV